MRKRPVQWRVREEPALASNGGGGEEETLARREKEEKFREGEKKIPREKGGGRRAGILKDITQRLSLTISTSVLVIILVDVHGLHVGYKGCFSVETRG